MIELPIRVVAPDVAHVDALACGTRLGEFEIRGLIGVGGFGMVYRAYDHSLQRDVAIKEYMPAALASRSGNALNISVRTATDQETFQTGLRSFVGEARMLAMFEHPSLVRVFRFWEANDTAYMVMPLYRGMTLKQARQRMRMPPSEAWLRKVLWSILGALKVLHRGRALHRDVSPDNIFLQDSGPPVLLDLGAARLAIGDTARQHTAILKINYAPIEQYADAHGLPQGPWTDLYALAAVVHGLLCNEAPLPSMIRVVNDRLPAFANIAKTVGAEFGQSYSQQFVDGIAWALHIQPQDRPQSVRDFARALGLATPNGMSTFDWRAELGPACLPVGEVLQLNAVPTREEKTQPDQTDPHYAPTQFIDGDADSDQGEAPRPTAAPQPKPESRPSTPSTAHTGRRTQPRHTSERTSVAGHPSSARRKSARAHPRSSGAWWVVASVAVAVLLVAAWAWRGSSDRAKAATSAASSTQSLSSPGTPTMPTSAASDVAGGAPAPLVIPPASATPTAAASPNALTKPNKASERVRNTPARVAKTEPASPSAPTPAPGTAATVSAAPPNPDSATATAAPSPEQLCADANVLTRPMCLWRACQRPDLVRTATCVQLEQRLQRDAEARKSN